VSEVSERYEAIAEGFSSRLAGVGPEGWLTPTPCADWSVTDLVAHVIMTQRRVLATLEGTEAADTDLDAALAPQWLAATKAISAALDDGSRASTLVSGLFGEQTFESLVGRLVCADTLVHTWDLARATGQDETLDPDAVAKAFEVLAPLDEAIRRPGGFGAKIVPPADADPQMEFLCFCGRAGDSPSG